VRFDAPAVVKMIEDVGKHFVIGFDPFDIEKLYLFKDQHEYWIQHTLSEAKDSSKTAQNVIYADLIDAMVEAGQLLLLNFRIALAPRSNLANALATSPIYMSPLESTPIT